jgi:Questin oxidase-like
MPSLALSPNTVSSSAEKTPAGTHVFTIMARMLKDPELKIEKPDLAGNFLNNINKRLGPKILKYAEQWSLDASDPKDVERKIEELIWMNTLNYGIGGWHKANGFKADFFLYVLN